MLTGPLLAAALLLAAAGISKLREPLPTQQALHDLGLPHGHQLVRVLGGTEVVAAVLAVFRPMPCAAGLATLYAAFAATIAYALLRRIPLASCGCAGQRQLPPSWLHVELSAVATVVGVLSAFGLAEAILPAARALGVFAVPFAAGVAAIAYLLFCVIAFGPYVFTPRTRHVSATEDGGGLT